MEEVKFDFQALIQQIKDEVMLEMLCTLAQDKDEADTLVNSMRVFIRNGVSIETALKIAAELGEVLGTNTNEE